MNFNNYIALRVADANPCKTSHDFSAEERNSLDVNRRQLPEKCSNLNTRSVNPTGDAEQSLRDLSDQGSLNKS